MHRAGRLTERDTIVLADFANSTGDGVFDGTLRQGMMVQLGEDTGFRESYRPTLQGLAALNKGDAAGAIEALAVARLQLGRAYAMAGDRGKAKAAYEDFLGLWKGADAGIPVLVEARGEYGRL